MVNSLRRIVRMSGHRSDRWAIRRVAAGLLCLSVLGGCGAKSPRTYPPQEARRLEIEIARTWEVMQRILVDRGYVIQLSDQPAGVIETDWITVNADYAASVFLTQNEDRYSDCGKPGLGKTYQGKQARLVVHLAVSGGNQTEVLVRAAFRTERNAAFSRSPTFLDCRSRGRLEEEILVETQIRALTNQLQRFRRGWQ
jgi:hypothetical protein